MQLEEAAVLLVDDEPALLDMLRECHTVQKVQMQLRRP